MKRLTDAHVHFGMRGDFDEKKAIENLLWDMDKNHIEKAFLFPIGCSLERNSQMLAAVSCLRERLLPFVWLNPNDKVSLGYFEQLIKSGIIGGLKLHPYSDKYSIDDYELLDPWMQLAENYVCHIIVHCTSGDPFCSPVQLEKLAVRYPLLTFQMAHMGAIWDCSEGIEVVSRNENIYADTSIASYSAVMRAGIQIPGRLLMGTDYPFYRFEMEHLKLQLAIEDKAHYDQVTCQNFIKLYHKLAW